MIQFVWDGTEKKYKVETHASLKNLSDSISSFPPYFFVYDTGNSKRWWATSTTTLTLTNKSVTLSDNSGANNNLRFNDNKVDKPVTLWFDATTGVLSYTAPVFSDITVNQPATGGSISASPSTRSASGTTVTLTNTPATGYEFGSWSVTDSSGALTVTNNEFTLGNTNATVTATFNAKTSTLSFNNNGATSPGTQTLSSTTATYNAALPAFDSYTAPQKTGYSLDGWYINGHKYYNADGTAVDEGAYSVWKENVTGAQTLTAQWSEVKAGATVKAKTNGSESGTGGKVRVGTTGSYTATATISNNTFGIGTASSAVSAQVATGYTFTGWTKGSTYGDHVVIYTDSTCNTLYTGNENPLPTTVYVKSDGYTLNTMNTSNTEIYANFTANQYTVTLDAASGTNGTGATIKKTAEIAAADSMTFTHTYGVASTLNTQYVAIIPATGYQFDGWYTGASDGSLVTSIAANGITADTTYYAHYSPKTSALTFNLNASSGQAASGTLPGAGTKIASYGSAMPAYGQSAPTRNGYDFNGYYDATSDGTQYYTSAVASARNWDKDITTGTTLYAQWTERLSTSTITAPAASNGTITKSGSGAGIDSFYTLTAAPSSGYAFTGWVLSGADEEHIILKDTSGNTLASGTRETTIRVFTDGSAAGLTAVLTGGFIADENMVTVAPLLATDGTGYKATDVSALTSGVSGGGTYTISEGDNHNGSFSAADDISGYQFIGWYAADSAIGAGSLPFSTVLTDDNASHSFTMDIGSKTIWYALYKKEYKISAFDSYSIDDEVITFRTSPPRSIVISSTVGATTTPVTYTYDASALKGNADTPVEYDGETLITHNTTVLTGGGTYGEGNYIRVLAGDTITLNFSALASSDTVTGVYFVNEVAGSPVNYVTTTPTSDIYNKHDDFTTAKTLYANRNYYDAATQAVIDANAGSYAIQPGNITNNSHTVSWTAAQDYKNIDIDIANKRRFIFVDSTGADILHENTSDYYDVGKVIGTNLFGVKAATSTTANYSFDPTLVAFFTNKACTTTVDSAYPGASIAIQTTDTDGNGYFDISGTMPNTDIYVKLNIATSYNLNLGSVIVSDTSDHYVSFAKVARIQAMYQPDATEYTYLDTTYDTASPAAVTWNSGAITAVAKGDSVSMTYKYWDLLDEGEGGRDAAAGYSGKYMFLGWYGGTSTGPDYDDFLSDRQTYTYTPKANSYVYAVGTRDLFINGSKYITGKDKHWNTDDGTIKAGMENLKMDFDPTFSETVSGTTYTGRYYWTITRDMFNTGATKEFYVGNTTSDHYNDNNKMGNSFFRILDTATGDQGYAFWQGIAAGDHTDSGNLHYGKIYYKNSDELKYANGYISFRTASKQSDGDYWAHEAAEGYDAPITIYAYPSGRIEVVPSPIYPDIYVSNGYAGIDSYSDTGSHNGQDTSATYTAADTGKDVTVQPVYGGEVVADGDTGYFACAVQGNGWDPLCEGHVNDWKIKSLNGTVRVTKTVSNAANYIVSAFEVYNLKTDKVTTYDDVQQSGNSFYVDITMNENESLYIVPIIEDAAADMTVLFDSTQLNTDEWGDFVSCYAWYAGGTAYGSYPGQLMVRSSDGKSWSAKLKSTDGSGNALVGILFANYYMNYTENNVFKAATWVSSNYVYKEEGGTRIIRSRDYNKIVNTENPTYSKTNFQAQTYDYREPIAMYINRSLGAGEKLTLSFALKKGNSGGVLPVLRHNELVGNNILSSFTHYHSDPSKTDTIVLDDSDFEYLTNAAGKYADLKGVALADEPTASYYIMAKGMVTYDKASKTIQRVFYSGNNYDAYTGYTYPKTFGTDLNYAVQWYVYDASGAYITNVLSAAYSDRVTDGEATNTLLVQALLDQGYAVDGRAVAICYDDPRYCYDTGGSPSVPNGNTTFQAYRFSGQWYATSSYQEVTVSVGVGMINESGDVTAFEPGEGEKVNVSGYGSATAAFDRTKATPVHSVKTGSDNEFVTTSLADAEKKALKLTASATNFAGWYILDKDTGELTDTGNTNPNFYPTYKTDVTYYAVYEANASYSYNFTGREGGSCAYIVSGGRMTDEEMITNKVSKSREDIGTKAPGSFSLFKRTITFNAGETENYNNETDYVLNINNPTVTTSKFTVTAYYPGSKGGANTDHVFTDIPYNTAFDVTDRNGDVNISTLAPDGRVFKGWYTAANGGGELLSTQANFGQVIVKDTTIYAYYDTAPYSSASTAWNVYIDDQEVTQEKYNTTDGRYYNDSIIRFRNDADVFVSIPDEAEVGILLIKDNGTNMVTTRTDEQLTNYASNLASGKTARITADPGLTVTKITATSMTMFNRADLAVRSDYAKTKGQNYSVYAYIKLGDNTCVFSTAKSGTYN